MRQIISSGSVRAIYLDREKILKKLKEICAEALGIFPEMTEIRLFGSFAKGEETGLSDVDIFIVVERGQENPIERMRPYFNYFSDKMDIAMDVIVTTKDEIENFKEILKGSILLIRREIM